MKCCDVRTNSLQQYHEECMKNSVEKINVDVEAKGLRKIVYPLLALPKEVGCPFLWHQMPTKHQGPSNSYSERKEGVMDKRTTDIPSLHPDVSLQRRHWQPLLVYL